MGPCRFTGATGLPGSDALTRTWGEGMRESTAVILGSASSLGREGLDWNALPLTPPSSLETGRASPRRGVTREGAGPWRGVSPEPLGQGEGLGWFTDTQTPSSLLVVRPRF